ncbi:hypothetical protein ACE41A_08780 [Bacillus cytotoxicus]|uniref:hypothetical protein n=1 Tax=Bacillus cytotoxicus TaxID=580165 RepID=UPI0035C9609B
MKHVKENDLVHGQWNEWCNSIGMSRNQATKFITVYKELAVNDSTSNQIGLEALYQIATLPLEQREVPHTIPSTGEQKTVDEMTVRELREVKKSLKEKDKLLEQAEHKIQESQRELEQARKSEQVAMKQLKSLKMLVRTQN